jgi:hypothetical protein
MYDVNQLWEHKYVVGNTYYHHVIQRWEHKSGEPNIMVWINYGNTIKMWINFGLGFTQCTYNG